MSDGNDSGEIGPHHTEGGEYTEKRGQLGLAWPNHRQAVGQARSRAPKEEASMTRFIKVATTDELEDEQAKLVEVEGQKMALLRVEGTFYALSDTCTHRGGPLPEGTVEGAEVTCPWHGGEVRHPDRGRPRGTGSARRHELPGPRHRGGRRD